VNSVICEGRPITPGKIVCVGRNYVEHIEELGNEIPEQMVLFLKPNSAISDTLYATRRGETLHYEGEIAFMVRGGRLSHLAFGLDLTRRELQAYLKDRGLPWERAKAFDGAALFGEFVPAPDNHDQLGLALTINGDLRQRGSCLHMLYKPGVILDEIRREMTLEDGDILMTGTPAGVGALQPGDQLHGQVLLDDQPIAQASWTAQAR
jgi:2-keto-4-pentenoate hydratase/2-oxohepta-3-ene-1,7-dioic acid hydratase in catechol pathway